MKIDLVRTPQYTPKLIMVEETNSSKVQDLVEETKDLNGRFDLFPNNVKSFNL